MPVEQLNIGTLDSRNLLQNASLTVEIDGTDVVIDVLKWEIVYGGKYPVYIIECGTTGDTHPLDADTRGSITVAESVKPTPNNGGSRKKKGKLK